MVVTIDNKKIVILIILLIATFFRLWQLDIVPPGIYPDEAINANEAISSAGKIFYPENNGREGFFINLIAMSFSIFGISIWSFKIVPAIIGILTVLGLYLLTKELFGYLSKNSTFIALLSSLFLAVSFWHINFSRIGFRAILVPFLLVFSFYFLFKGFRTQKLWNFILSGIFFGLGFHTYISYRLIVLILPLIFILWWFIYKKKNLQRKFLLFVIYWSIAAIIVALPIGFYFLQNPQDFIGRAGGVSIFAAENPIKEFGKSLILHLGIFNFYGDGNWRHNFAGSPMLFWPIGIFFLTGFFISIKRFISSIKEKNLLIITSYSLLFAWFLAMILPGALTYEGIPHALRVIGIIPIIYIFAGFGGWKTYQWFKKNTKYRKLLLSASLLFLVMVGTVQFDKYFIKWANLSEVKGSFSNNYVEIGNYLNSLPQDTQKYVIVNQGGVPVPFPDGIPMPAQTVMFIENTKPENIKSIYLLPENLEKIKTNTKKTIIILLAFDENLFQKLKEKFPQGKIQQKEEIWLYKINY